MLQVRVIRFNKIEFIEFFASDIFPLSCHDGDDYFYPVIGRTITLTIQSLPVTCFKHILRYNVSFHCSDVLALTELPSVSLLKSSVSVSHASKVISLSF